MQHQIYFCDIQMKHNQHTYETHETYGCKVCSSTCCRPIEASWRGAEERSVRHEQGTWGARRGWREARAGCAARGARRVRCDCMRREVYRHTVRGTGARRAHVARGGSGATVGGARCRSTWREAHGCATRDESGALPNRSTWHNFLFFSLTLPLCSSWKSSCIIWFYRVLKMSGWVQCAVE
jgi:hypothetical protein